MLLQHIFNLTKNKQDQFDEVCYSMLFYINIPHFDLKKKNSMGIGRKTAPS